MAHSRPYNISTKTGSDPGSGPVTVVREVRGPCGCSGVSVIVGVVETVGGVVRASDGVSTTLELLPVTDAATTARLLGDELRRRGFDVCTEAGTRIDPDGLEIVVDLRTGVVAVTLGVDEAVELIVEGEAVVGRAGSVDETAVDDARSQLVDDLRAAGAEELERRSRLLREAATERLTAKLGEIQRELRSIETVVTVDQLRLKAASLGEIRSVSSDGSGGVVIVVEVASC